MTVSPPDHRGLYAIWYERAPEVMELLGGRCRVRLAGETAWKDYAAGASFSVPGNSSFDIEVAEAVDYVCHFG